MVFTERPVRRGGYKTLRFFLITDDDIDCRHAYAEQSGCISFNYTQYRYRLQVRYNNC